ncbi:HIT domain-containing protein [Candidatus Woesearchaeota archaeon]|nr:HIT domain-containing protein [Candidatus Woesearchaeota archaeon]
MQLTPEIKAQIEEQKKQCVFCKVISKEMEGQIVFEDDKTIALLDIYPAVKGHTVYMLKEHYPLPSFIPAEDFIHKFGLIPQLAKAVKEGILTTGVNVFISLGGVAGQQSPHFLAHLLPRERDDKFYNFEFKKGKQIEEEKGKVLVQNFPLMMANFFQRSPAPWHQGPGNVPGFLTPIYEKAKVLYEDERVLCLLSSLPAVPGHLEIYSKEAERNIEELSPESSAHLFFTASLAATLIFEALGVQGTNILLKSGFSDDNPKGRLVINILPRKQNDALQNIIWQPQQPTYDVKEIAKRIKDYSWKVKYKKKELERKPGMISTKPIVFSERKEEKRIYSVDEEIRKAIERVK